MTSLFSGIFSLQMDSFSAHRVVSPLFSVIQHFSVFGNCGSDACGVWTVCILNGYMVLYLRCVILVNM